MNTQVEIPLAYAGFLRATVRKAATEEVVSDTGWFPNAVLDTGLNRMGVGAYGNACAVGSGNTPPAYDQTGLATQVAMTTTQQSNTAGRRTEAPYYGWTRRVFRFAAGVAAGTLAEIGIGWYQNPGPTMAGFFSRALILDLDGNPTTITVLADEVLDITYELRMYPDLEDKVFTAEIAGVEYNCILRACDVDGVAEWSPYLDGAVGLSASDRGYVYNGVIGTVTGNPSGQSDYARANSNAAYVNGSLERAFVSTWDLNYGNLPGGVTVFLYYGQNGGRWQQSFSPAIPKDGTKTLVLSAKFIWTRYIP